MFLVVFCANTVDPPIGFLHTTAIRIQIDGIEVKIGWNKIQKRAH